MTEPAAAEREERTLPPRHQHHLQPLRPWRALSQERARVCVLSKEGCTGRLAFGKLGKQGVNGSPPAGLLRAGGYGRQGPGPRSTDSAAGRCKQQYARRTLTSKGSTPGPGLLSSSAADSSCQGPHSSQLTPWAPLVRQLPPSCRLRQHSLFAPRPSSLCREVSSLPPFFLK